MTLPIPSFEDVICIGNREERNLIAVISSFFSQPGKYFPVFHFSEMKVARSENFDFNQDNFIPLIMGDELAVLINNAVTRMRGRYRHILFGGLTENQKSFLMPYLKGTSMVEINNMNEIPEKLDSIGISKAAAIRCRQNQLLEALFWAKKTDHYLQLDENADIINFDTIPHRSDFFMVVEETDDTSSVIAVNYAFSVDARLKIISGTTEAEADSARDAIQIWNANGKRADRAELAESLHGIAHYLRGIDFSAYKFATFFTEYGLPYSLAIENVVPSSYVNLRLRPDFFIFNNLFFANSQGFASAIIFSPEFFEDEETKFLSQFLRDKKLHVKELTAKMATVDGFDFYASHFPYDILHICSHGGEVEGYTVLETFQDRNGVSHSVEYDEVLGFSPVPGKELIAIHRKVFFRKFDGFEWMSPELNAQNIPSFVFEDLRKFLFHRDEFDKTGEVIRKDRVPTSCAVKCSDSIHQGTFHVLASHTSPIVFNNTCWSWFEIAKTFLAAGARGYIGTLWAIGNNSAILAAETFYKNAFDSSAALALYESLKAIRSSADRDIYIYWGLHFGGLMLGKDSQISLENILSELKQSLFSWIDKIKSTKDAEVKRNSLDILRRIYREITEQHGLPRNTVVEEFFVSQKETVREDQGSTSINLQEQRFAEGTEYKKS